MDARGLLIWDFHGTLVHSDDIWSKSALNAVKEVFPEAAVSIEDIESSTDFVLFPWEQPAGDYRDFVDKDRWWLKINKIYRDTFQRLGFSRKVSTSLADLVRKYVVDSFIHQLKEDAISTLAYLKKRGWKSVILSNNFPELGQVCDDLQISKYFDEIIVSALVGFEKPRREMFDRALRHQNQGETFVIGDNEYADILGARQVGLDSIFISQTGSALASYTCRHLSDIPEILESRIHIQS